MPAASRCGTPGAVWVFGGRRRGTGAGGGGGQSRVGSRNRGQIGKGEQQGVAAHPVGLPGMFQQHPKVIEGGQRERHQIPGRGEGALADLLKHRFDVMGKVGERVPPEHRAGALEGMKGSERLIDQFPTVRRRLQVKQRRLQHRQQVGGLLPEHLFGLYRGRHPESSRRVVSNLYRDN